MVNSPRAALRELLTEERKERSHQIAQGARDFAERFFQDTGIKLEFDEGAVNCLEEKIFSGDCETNKFLEQLFSNYKYGLELIQKKHKRDLFLITADVVDNPNAHLDRWIKETYEG